MLKLFISMAALFLGVGSSVFAQIEGKVYIDANGNGICDAGERGLKGVCVQDGLNVVKTTDDGHFILPGHKDTRFVTLTVPDGYQASTSHYLSFDGPEKSMNWVSARPRRYREWIFVCTNYRYGNFSIR